MNALSYHKRAVLFRVFMLLCLVFIWGQSCVPSTGSSAESGYMTRLLTPFLEHFVGRGNVTDHLVRKLAHFTEYGALGTCMMHYAWFSAKTDLRQVLRLIIKAWLIAFLDETIQIFTGRGPYISDVWLDLAGVLTALGLFAAAHFIKKKICRPKAGQKT